MAQVPGMIRFPAAQEWIQRQQVKAQMEAKAAGAAAEAGWRKIAGATPMRLRGKSDCSRNSWTGKSARHNSQMIG